MKRELHNVVDSKDTMVSYNDSTTETNFKNNSNVHMLAAYFDIQIHNWGEAGHIKLLQLLMALVGDDLAEHYPHDVIFVFGGNDFGEKSPYDRMKDNFLALGHYIGRFPRAVIIGSADDTTWRKVYSIRIY